MNARAAQLLAGLPDAPKLIEIGPSYNPLAPKREGWNTTVVDHASREGLIEKYALDRSVNPAMIEDVDVIWTGGPLADVVPAAQHGTFDAFLASHVIEHTPDIVRFLQSAEKLLKPEGQVLLIVPDKRKCFDFFRSVSMTSDTLIAYREARQRHSAKTLFDNSMYVSLRNGCPAWYATETAPSTLVAPLSRGLAIMAQAAADEYVDAHAWTFTPASFELMILELTAMGFLNLTVSRVLEAPATDFSAWLSKGSSTLSETEMETKRLELMNRMVVEVAEQSRQIIDSPLELYSRHGSH